MIDRKFTRTKTNPFIGERVGFLQGELCRIQTVLNQAQALKAAAAAMREECLFRESKAALDDFEGLLSDALGDTLNCVYQDMEEAAQWRICLNVKRL